MNENYMNIDIKPVLENVAIVRVAISAILSNLDITIDELMDVKTAVSEAVTNSISHGYDKNNEEINEQNNANQKVEVNTLLKQGEEGLSTITIKVRDTGVGIDDVELATTPAYTSKPELEHAGMGFTIMETFMDEIIIDSTKNEGTTITLIKEFRKKRSKV